MHQESNKDSSPPTFLSYLGNKFLRSELSLTSPTRSSALFLATFLLSFLRPGLGSSRALGCAGTVPRRTGARRDGWGWGPLRTMRAPWSAVRNSSNPSCWNARRRRLLHSGPNVFVITPDRLPACRPARAAVAPALGRTTLALCGAGARSPSQFTDPTKPLGSSPNPRPLCLSRSRHGCAESGPGSHRAQRRPVITRFGSAPCAPGGHPRSGPLQPSPSRLPPPQPLPRLTLRSLLPTSLGPRAALHTTGCSVVPPNRGRGMKILIKNLSPSRTHCQEEGKHLCPYSQHYLVLVPVYTNTTPNPQRNLKNVSLNNFFGRPESC